MGRVVQQINLYRARDARRTESTSVRMLVLSGVGALCLVTLLAVGGEIFLSGVAADRAIIAESLRSRQAELETFSATLSPPPVDPHLEAELVRLRETRDRVNATLTAIAGQEEISRGGFAEYFGGLARNTLDGLWFNNVSISAGGGEMLLKGRATEPELVPRLLQILAAEKAFSGRAFRKVLFERQTAESGELVDFELRSAGSAEIDDAG